MSDITEAFNRLRYAADPAWEPRGHEPVGFEVTAGGDTIRADTPRWLACEFMKDNGRYEEAESIQHHDGPVLMHEGKVKPGRYDHQPLMSAYEAALDHLNEWSGGEHQPYTDFYPHPNGEPHLFQMHGADDHLETYSMATPTRRPEAAGLAADIRSLHSGREPSSDSPVRTLHRGEHHDENDLQAVHTALDQYSAGGREESDQAYWAKTIQAKLEPIIARLREQNNRSVHIEDLGESLADRLHEDVNGVDYGWNTDDNERYPDEDEQEQMGAEFDRLLHVIRTTPVVRPVAP